MIKTNPGALRARNYTKRRQEQGDVKTTVWLKGKTNAVIQEMAKQEGVTRDELIERICNGYIEFKTRPVTQLHE